MGWIRWRRAAIATGLLIVAALLLTHVPAALAFPYAAQIGVTRVHAEVPIDPRIGAALARADRLLAASPIDAPIARDLYLTQGGWRWQVLALTSRGAFAFRRPFSDAIVVNRSDVARDRVWNGAAVGGRRTLSGVIAHETTHLLLAHRFGEIAMAVAPAWKQEGYADHVAQESSLSDADAARLRASGTPHPALAYYDGRRQVAAVLARNGGSVDALFR